MRERERLAEAFRREARASKNAKDADLRAEKARARAKRIRTLIGPFVLRRLKSQVLEALPPKTEEVTTVAMTPAQSTIYKEAIARIAAQHSAASAGCSMSRAP